MTIDNVQDITPRRQYVATAGQTVFAYPFPIFADADLIVVVNNTTKLLTTDYTVSGSGTNTGGNVTLLVGCTVGDIVTIYRNMAIARSTNFQQNGPLNSATINTELDRLTLMIQQVEEDLARALRIPITANVVDSDISLDPSTWASKYMTFDANGKPTPAVLSSTAMTQAIIGGLLNPRTQVEINAGVVPTNLAYMADDPRRLGVTGDGVADDTAAFANVALVAAKGQHFRGRREAVYVLSSAVTLGAKFSFDGNGATVKASTTAGRFISTAPVATATTTVSSGATQGSRSVVVASATGLVIGQWVRIWDSLQYFPAYWGTITSIGGTTIGLDRPMPLNYTGTLNFLAYNTSVINDTVEIKNLIIDGTNIAASPGNDGSGLRILGYEFVRLSNIRLQNFNPASTGANIVHLEDNISVEIDQCYSKNCSVANAVGSYVTYRARKVTYTRCQLEADTFGLNADWCETAVFNGNSGQGRIAFETGTGVSPERSVRGIKFLGCADAVVVGNHMADYESPIRGERLHRFNVTGNTLVNCGLSAYTGQIALNISNSVFVDEIFGIIANNQLSNCGGVGIGVDDANGSVTDSNVEITGNVIDTTAGIAIYVNIPKAAIHNNKIRNWNTRAAAGDLGAAVYCGAGLLATNNEFKNTTNTYPNFRSNFVSSAWYYFAGNISPTGNPNFSTGLDVQTRGTATIAAASTSIVVTHGCVHTPTVQDLSYNVGTLGTPNAPGEIVITAVSSTQFTINCRNTPGAGGMNVYWAITPRGPWQAP